MLTVIKIGGNIVDNPDALDSFLADFSKIEGSKILVHGGGKVATKVSKALGIEAQMIDGRRVTDAETVKVVTMVYAGLVNKTIVSKLQALDCNALGLSGADANVIRSHKRIVKDIDYGFVGDVDEVNASFLTTVLEQGVQPVMAPITHDKEGLLLNTNADTIASTVAVAMSQVMETQLIYCFELEGVMRDINDKDSVISQITPSEYKELKEEGVIVAGMIPKMDNCFDAISQGVSKVRIAHASDLKAILSEGVEKGTTLQA
ncbi:MAG: acetylglutamate kinase [Cytophagales bacterium]|nr:acetylglutamate kinase [Cytophagales bacterium]